jgi:uncharacterized protein YjbJ (UPF0337 family)
MASHLNHHRLLMFVHGDIDCRKNQNLEEYKMNWDRTTEYMKELMNTVKDQWFWFVDDQIDVLQGKRDHFYGKTSRAYVIDNEEADKRLADWQKLKWDKVRVPVGQKQINTQPAFNGEASNSNKDPANRNWQFRSE